MTYQCLTVDPIEDKQLILEEDDDILDPNKKPKNPHEDGGEDKENENDDDMDTDDDNDSDEDEEDEEGEAPQI